MDSDWFQHMLPTLPFLVLNCLVMPYLTLPYLTVLNCLVMPYLALPYLTLPYMTVPYLTLPLSLPLSRPILLFVLSCLSGAVLSSSCLRHHHKRCPPLCSITASWASASYAERDPVMRTTSLCNFGSSTISPRRYISPCFRAMLRFTHHRAQMRNDATHAGMMTRKSIAKGVPKVLIQDKEGKGMIQWQDN